MPDNTITCRFAINTWQHLYSLQQAVRHAESMAANQLIIAGTIRNETIFDRRDTPIRLTFSLLASPQYQRTADGQFILGQLSRGDSLSAEIPVDEHVFAELKKNLVEYIGIDGIHIVVAIGFKLPETGWLHHSTADILQLDYAMKGDGG